LCLLYCVCCIVSAVLCLLYCVCCVVVRLGFVVGSLGLVIGSGDRVWLGCVAVVSLTLVRL
jgi:hypothetical protein